MSDILTTLIKDISQLTRIQDKGFFRNAHQSSSKFKGQGLIEEC